MSSLRLREFLPGDLEAAYGLDQICFEPGIAYSRSELRGFLARAGSVALIAEDGGTLVEIRVREGAAVAEGDVLAVVRE